MNDLKNITFDQLYSRQIATFGKETNSKICNLKVLIIGIKGIGLEIAKNIAIQGASKIAIFDSSLTLIEDLGTNFYLDEKDIGIKRRDEAILKKLQKLNDYANIICLNKYTKIEELYEIVEDYSIVIITELLSKSKAIYLNELCRKKNVKFIYCALTGLSFFIFTDFGNEHIIYGTNDDELLKYYVKNITKGKKGIVEIEESKNIIYDNMYIKFKGVEGMTEINSQEYYKVEKIDDKTFYIGDTSKFSDYIKGGIIEEIEIPIIKKYKSLKEILNGEEEIKNINSELEENLILNNDEYNKEIVNNIDENKNYEKNLNNSEDESSKDENSTKNSDESKISIDKDINNNLLKNINDDDDYSFYDDIMYVIGSEEEGRCELLFLLYLKMMEYLDNNNKYPDYNNKDFQKIIKNFLLNKKNKFKFKWFNRIKEFNDKIIEYFIKYIQTELSCFTTILGGIVTQEVIKSTGKYIPIEQIIFFDFFKIAEELNLNIDLSKLKKDRYYHYNSIFGEETMNKLQNKKLLLVGAGALGCELLKIYALLGIKNVNVVDNDYIELSNLSRQYFYHKEHIGKSKVEISCKAVLEINNELKNYNPIIGKICKETEDQFNKKFWDDQDILISAIDTLSGRLYLDNKSTLYEIPMLNGGTNKSSGKNEMFIPFKTCCFSDYSSKIKEDIDDSTPSCTLRLYPSRINDCIKWAREIIFEDLLINPIKILKKLISNGKEIYIQNLKEDLSENNNNNENNSELIINLKILKIYLNLLENENENDFIRFGLIIFNLIFKERIVKLLKENPLDKLNSDLTPFWSGSRRPPHIIKFNLKEGLDYLFIEKIILILHDILGIAYNQPNKKKLKKKIKKVIKKINLKNNLYSLEYLEDNNKILNDIFIKINNLSSKLNKVKKEYAFEKDIPEKGHVDFIHAISNLRANNYNIPQCDKYKTFKVVGKIGAQIISSTTCTSGFSGLQLILLTTENEKLYFNSSFNLSENIIAIGDIFKPISKEETENGQKIIPKLNNSWDKIILKGSFNINQIIEYFEKLYKIDLNIIEDLNGNIIYKKPIQNTNKKELGPLAIRRMKLESQKNEKEKNMKIEEIVLQIKKKKNEKFNETNLENPLYLTISGYVDNNLIITPIIKYIY